MQKTLPHCFCALKQVNLSIFCTSLEEFMQNEDISCVNILT